MARWAGGNGKLSIRNVGQTCDLDDLQLPKAILPNMSSVESTSLITLDAKTTDSMGSLDKTPLRCGFIGLGVMGWGMANNIRCKLPESDSLCVCELNKERLMQWLAQAPGKASIRVAQTPREVVENSVRRKTNSSFTTGSNVV